MWAYETTFYQIYPLGFCGAPRENAAPVAEDELAQAANAAPNPDAPIMKIAQWADYLQKLGIGAVLINPPLESDSHGYDTRSLRHIDRRLGGDADFAAVCGTLHAHGIRVVLDAVFNHVGRGFWAFRDVQEHKWDSPYKDWFHISFDGDSCYGDGFWYEGWEGHFELVKLNLQNPAVVDYLLESVRRWAEVFGVDGLRLDVAYMLDRDFMRRLHSFARELKPDFVLIGETLHGDYSQIVNDEMLDSCTNYECYKGLYSSFNSVNMFEIAHSLHRQFGGDPWCIYRGKHLLSFVDNHDVPRLASILTDKSCLRPAYGMLFGMPGIPCLYYGSEWGQLGQKGTGYLADVEIRPQLDAPAADALEHLADSWEGGGAPNQLTGYISELNHVRRASRALCHGSYRNVVITNKQLLFERDAAAESEQAPERVLVAVNAEDCPFTLNDGTLNGRFEVLLASAPCADDSNAAPDYPQTGDLLELEGSLTLLPYGVLYLRRTM